MFLTYSYVNNIAKIAKSPELAEQSRFSTAQRKYYIEAQWTSTRENNYQRTECTSFGKDDEEIWKLLLRGNIGGWGHMESKADLLHEELQWYFGCW